MSMINEVGPQKQSLVSKQIHPRVLCYHANSKFVELPGPMHILPQYSKNILTMIGSTNIHLTHNQTIDDAAENSMQGSKLQDDGNFHVPTGLANQRVL